MTTQFNPQLAEQHLNKLLRFYNIEVRKWSAGSNGRSDFSRRIKIPQPTNVDRFCVCMHEIKHCIDSKKGKLYEREYACEMFAIQQAESLGFDCSDYKERARRYIIMNIAKGYCRNLNLSTIQKEIKDFCAIDFSKWEGKKVYVSGWGHGFIEGKPLVISYQ